MRCLQSLIFGLMPGVALAMPSPPRVGKRQNSSETTSATRPNPTICGEIIDDVNDGYRVFYAEAAYSCMTSVPFNGAVALRFIEYYNTTMQFQSSLAYLKNPPEGYQQPAFDLFEGLEQLKRHVTSGVYKNQYAFEADLQHMVYLVHDMHVDLYAGVLSAFSFASPYEIVSASVDGKETPKVYLKDDVITRQQEGGDISPIDTINGEDVVDYLTRFAALQSVGMVEPHGDWNQLMGSPVLDIQGAVNIFSGGATFYPGDPSLGYYGDALNITFANGSDPIETYWLAVYNNPYFTGPLTTGGDFFNYFVLGLVPDSYDDVPVPAAFIDDPSVGVGQSTNDTDLTSGWSNITDGAYPVPDLVEESIDTTDGRLVTGYFLDDISIGVLSIPSFDEYSVNIGSFADAVSYFANNATDRGISRVVIDLQQNLGGTSELVFTTFKRLFPDIDPFAGSRRRSHEMGDVLGTSVTNYWESLSLDDDTEMLEKYSMAADEWVITTRINAETGENFTSWDEYSRPRDDNGDKFSLTERYDLANEYFDAAAFDGWVPLAYIPGHEPTWSAPWAPKDVLILTDGICSSACALFVEMMTQQGGVRTLVVGGSPSPGPMQTAGGSRGARLYSSYALDDDLEGARTYDETAANRFPEFRDTGMVVGFASFNLRDQIRDRETVPLQFKYAAADCRIWYTLDNIWDMEALWRDAARATWDDPSLCVEGSTGFSTAADNKLAAANPPPAPTSAAVSLPDTLYTQDYDPDETDGLPAAHGAIGKPPPNRLCNPDKGKTECGSRQACVLIRVPCYDRYTRTTTTPEQVYACVNKCQKPDYPCPGSGETCATRGGASASSRGTSGVSSKNARASLKTPSRSGYCVPVIGTPALGCPA